MREECTLSGVGHKGDRGCPVPHQLADTRGNQGSQSRPRRGQKTWAPRGAKHKPNVDLWTVAPAAPTAGASRPDTKLRGGAGSRHGLRGDDGRRTRVRMVRGKEGRTSVAPLPPRESNNSTRGPAGQTGSHSPRFGKATSRFSNANRGVCHERVGHKTPSRTAPTGQARPSLLTDRSPPTIQRGGLAAIRAQTVKPGKPGSGLVETGSAASEK